MATLLSHSMISVAISFFYYCSKRYHSSHTFTLNFPLSILNSPLLLVPLNVALRLTPLLILQVLQDTCIRPNRHIIIFPAPER